MTYLKIEGVKLYIPYTATTHQWKKKRSLIQTKLFEKKCLKSPHLFLTLLR